MNIDLFFWKDYRDPYAIYDVYGDRYWTGGLERIERLLIASKLIYYSYK